MNVIDIADRIQTEGDAYRYLEGLRWPDGPTCPHCGSEEVTFLNPSNGSSRKTSGGATMSQRRVWQCRPCRKQFSVLTGTCFHGSKISVRKWVFVLFEMCCSKNGVAAREIQRKYGLCSRTAWFMMHRIREAMKDDGLTMFRGVVVADETYFGGSFDNMHRSQRPHFTKGRAGGPYDKTPVLSLIDATTGQARSRVLPRVDGANLRKAIAEQVDLPNTILHTDRHGGYKVVAREVAAHHSVDHQDGEYVRDGVSTNKAENFFSQLKRSIDGTHHHVSEEHLGRYLAEFDFRFNTRKESDTARMIRLMGQVGGKRLTYKLVTG